MTRIRFNSVYLSVCLLYNKRESDKSTTESLRSALARLRNRTGPSIPSSSSPPPNSSSSSSSPIPSASKDNTHNVSTLFYILHHWQKYICTKIQLNVTLKIDGQIKNAHRALCLCVCVCLTQFVFFSASNKCQINSNSFSFLFIYWHCSPKWMCLLSSARSSVLVQSESMFFFFWRYTKLIRKVECQHMSIDVSRLSHRFFHWQFEQPEEKQRAKKKKENVKQKDSKAAAVMRK